ncbi:MAG: aromatic aminobenezylarsenical efflux permease ArsG family transporter [Prevotellaceae bacterium]|nr:aromatic aminobenezylarsenical efflux permease ArsG family transporter [Prevotellaceae bacterium]
MDLIQNMIESSELPALTAFLLGLVVALHPCPLATNIAAMGYIARHVHDRKRVFLNGLFYTLGRVIAYSLLGVILISLLRSGADMLSLSDFFGEWGERLLAPILIIIGVYFLLSRHIHKEDHCPNVGSGSNRFKGWGGSLLLGILLALSFCPESAIVYFGMLIPLSSKSTAGYMLPVVFSIATAIPTILMAWAASYGIAGSPIIKQRIEKVQRGMNVFVGILFLAAGIFCLFF